MLPHTSAYFGELRAVHSSEPRSLLHTLVSVSMISFFVANDEQTPVCNSFKIGYRWRAKLKQRKNISHQDIYQPVLESKPNCREICKLQNSLVQASCPWAVTVSLRAVKISAPTKLTEFD